jgi:hypothetical protein
MTPGFAKPRSELPWLPYEEQDRVIINSHNFTSAWTPANLSPAIWLDASDASTLYDSTSGGSLVAADGTIARWEDKSGNSRHFTQATSGRRPLRKTAVQNARDIVRFDGSDDNMRLLTGLSGMVQNVSGATVAAVISHRSTPTTSRVCFYASTGTSGGSGRLSLATAVTASNRQTLFGRRLDAQASASILSGSNNIGTAFVSRIGVAKYATSDADLYRAASADGSSTNWTTDGSTSNTAPLTVSIGALVTETDLVSSPADIDLCELIVTDAAESAGTLASIEAYFAAKWGV